jgi:diadenosine tetraphosphate (Ap4A) HIT family hydrolase
MSDCLPCSNNSLEPSELPPRERVYDDGFWRVAHAFNSALPGWMVVIARRHITSLAETTPEEAAALGPLLRGLSQALAQVVQAQKCYVLFFAEAEGFGHVHIHVVPRHVDVPADRRGAQVFGYLSQPQDQWITSEEMDRIARDVGILLRAG